MKKILLFLLLLASPVNAQIFQTHAPALNVVYNSPDDWPFSSDQCHWMVDGVLAHTHVEMAAPLYAEIVPNTKIKVPLTLKLFHTAGKITTLWSENGNIVLDNVHPVDPIYPNLIGDPSGVSTWTGFVTFDTNKNNTYGTANANGYSWSPHGYTEVRVVARTAFPDGTQTDTSLEIPFYSLLHPEVAEIPFPEGRLHPIRASCVPSQDSFGGSWGNMISEFREFIPVVPMPLGTTMNPPIQGYSYGVSTSIAPLGTLDRRLDPDLHNGIVGLEITSPSTFDTNVSGLGLHKFSFIWDTKTGTTPPVGFHANREGAALLVVNVKVGDGTITPPPPTPCTAGDSNTGIIVVDNVVFNVKITVDSLCHPTLVLQ